MKIQDIADLFDPWERVDSENGNFVIHQRAAELPDFIYPDDLYLAGIDPGLRKLGISTLAYTTRGCCVSSYQINILPKERGPVLLAICEALDYVDFSGMFYMEGPSFGSRFQQPQLGFARGFITAQLYHFGHLEDLVPPSSAKKSATGNGKYEYKTLWGKKYEDAAASLGVLLYGVNQHVK